MRGIRRIIAAISFVGAALLVTLVLARTILGIPSADLPAFAELLALVGGGVALVALLVMQPAVLGRVGGVRAELVGAGLIGSLLLLGMMLAGARAMFLSAHDLSVLLTMLLFAALLAVGLNLLWAEPFAGRIERLRLATEQMAAGRHHMAVVVEGHDEIAELGRAFNSMATALAQASAQERGLEQARRDLVAAVSHDLRTPLAAMQALIEAILDGVADDPQTVARYLGSVQYEISHLSRLVDDLFELSQIEAGVLQLHLEPGSLHDLISDTLASLQPHAERKQVQLIGQVAPAVDPVLMNAPRLQRVLHNLISNALRHTPANGEIRLRAETRGRFVQVEVEDTGEGIPSGDLPLIFERTFRGERARTRGDGLGSSGAGLGLTIARGLIEAHGGSISVESQAGRGTCFRFTLRRAV
jgi:signal transduction histidine kinase